MISIKNREFLFTPIAEYIISSEKVAHVQVGNNAEHALLVYKNRLFIDTGT